MPKPKFTDTELKQLVNKGLTNSEIAKKFGVTPGAITQRRKALKLAASKEVALVRAGEVVRKELNAVEQLQKINGYANELLDLLMRWNRGDEGALQILESQVRTVKVRGQEEEVTEYKFKDPRELALKAMGEIRGQLKLQLEIFQALYDIQAVAEFQKEVLETIGNVSPETRDEIIYRLKEKRAIRAVVSFS
jgi:DNA-binding CsgD family transcriptional regulator